jgi:hypothetical protein
MDHAVALVEAYLRVNGYFTVSEYPVVEARQYGGFRTATDLDILAFRFPGAGRLVPPEPGDGNEDNHSYAPDPELGCPSDCAEMLIGEVKEGKAEMNEAARDPAVLQAALTRFGCCHQSRVPEVVRQLLQQGHAMTHCGHRVRLVAFGVSPGRSGSPKYEIISLGHIQRFLNDYICQHWEVLHQAQFKDPVFGFLVMLEKGHRGHAPAPERV